MEKIDKLDRQILEIISQNARIPFKDVAAECGVSRAAIHQRVQRLIDMGVIIGSGYNVNPKSLGYRTCTYVGIKLEKGSMYKEAVKELKKIPEISGRQTYVSYVRMNGVAGMNGVDDMVNGTENSMDNTTDNTNDTNGANNNDTTMNDTNTTENTR